MRYVTEILKDGQPIIGRFYKGEGLSGISTIVGDTNRGSDRRVFFSQDTLGVAIGPWNVIVKHDAITAKLHEYIAHAESGKVPEGGGSGYYRSVTSLLNEPDEQITLISVPDELIQTYGTLGSVVCRISVDTGRPVYCTLYELLVDLSKQIGCNLMSSQTLLIDSGSISLRTAIVFRHGVEADRFFTKMAVAGNVSWR